MKIRVDVNKRYAISVGLFVLLVALGIFVVAYGGIQPSVMGHTANEVHVNIDGWSNPANLGNFINNRVCFTNAQGSWRNCPPESLPATGDYFYLCSSTSPLVGCRVFASNDPDIDVYTLKIGVDDTFPGEFPDCWTMNSPPNIPQVSCQRWGASGGGLTSCMNQAEDYFNTLNIDGSTGGWDLMYYENTGESGAAPNCQNDATSKRYDLTFGRYTP